MLRQSKGDKPTETDMKARLTLAVQALLLLIAPAGAADFLRCSYRNDFMAACPGSNTAGIRYCRKVASIYEVQQDYRYYDPNGRLKRASSLLDCDADCTKSIMGSPNRPYKDW